VKWLWKEELEISAIVLEFHPVNDTDEHIPLSHLLFVWTN